MQREYLADAKDVLDAQATSAEDGLTSAVAADRLRQAGPNKLDEAAPVPLWKRFFEQMADPMVIMLIVAAVISALTGMEKGKGSSRLPCLAAICSPLIVPKRSMTRCAERQTSSRLRNFIDISLSKPNAGQTSFCCAICTVLFQKPAFLGGSIASRSPRYPQTRFPCVRVPFFSANERRNEANIFRFIYYFCR